MSRWNPPTAGDAVQQALPGLEVRVLELRCRCGRVTTSDMVRDLRTVPTALRDGAGLAAFACDACTDRADRTGQLPTADLMEALGAPAAEVARARGKRGAAP